mmetsp:Transcript_26627/g.26271  ORF Transcript_26627/g.26271 Transcript_26627/m.26271 type:complete len:93 (+) Transcript_26627:3-281(+)
MFGGKTQQGVTDTTNENAGLVKDFRNTTCRLPPTIKKDEHLLRAAKRCETCRRWFTEEVCRVCHPAWYDACLNAHHPVHGDKEAHETKVKDH